MEKYWYLPGSKIFTEKVKRSLEIIGGRTENSSIDFTNITSLYFIDNKGIIQEAKRGSIKYNLKI